MYRRRHGCGEESKLGIFRIGGYGYEVDVYGIPRQARVVAGAKVYELDVSMPPKACEVKSGSQAWREGCWLSV